ncbi:unnamed protein product [Owenia fusiformis]|uniref:Uncharacterized protein n=1 Tax=Owenia fusiformis TaxID=6347 RepID=A0A8J1XK42_OWEFU|nr:unnamed protein product [Owenia fusiformis]
MLCVNKSGAFDSNSIECYNYQTDMKWHIYCCVVLLLALNSCTAQVCPNGCNCYKPEAKWFGPDLYHTACDELALTNVPSNIPHMTTDLSLSGNQISTFGQEIGKMTKLKALYLRQNNIRTVDANMLQTLKGIPKLQAIDLSGNPWDCSCTEPMRQFTIYIQTLKGPRPLDGHRWLAHVNGYDATCKTPERLKGKRIDELLASDICQ